MLPLLTTMAVDDVVEAAGAVGEEQLVRLFRAAQQAQLVPNLLALAGDLDDDQRSWLAAVAAAMPEVLQDRFTTEVDRAQLWLPLFEFAAALPPDARAGLARPVRRIAAARPELVEQLAELAESRGLADLAAEARAAVG